MTLQISLAASFYKIQPIYNYQTDSACDYLWKHTCSSALLSSEIRIVYFYTHLKDAIIYGLWLQRVYFSKKNPTITGIFLY
jgi:hypothetical protein